MLMRELKDFDPANVMARKMPLDQIVRSYALSHPNDRHDAKVLLNTALRVLGQMFQGVDIFPHFFEPKKAGFLLQMKAELEGFDRGEWLLMTNDELSAAMEEFAREPDLKLNELAFAA